MDLHIFERQMSGMGALLAGLCARTTAPSRVRPTHCRGFTHPFHRTALPRIARRLISARHVISSMHARILLVDSAPVASGTPGDDAEQ